MSAQSRHSIRAYSHLLGGLLECSCGQKLRHEPRREGPQYRVDRATRVEGHHHLLLNQANADQFFRDLVRHRGKALVEIGVYTGKQVERYLATLQEKLHKREMWLPDRQSKARYNAVRMVYDYGRDLIRSERGREAARQTLEEMLMAESLQEIAELRDCIAGWQAVVDAWPTCGTLQEMMAQWDTHEVSEQNRLLRRLVRVVRLEGNPPKEELRLSLNYGRDLPRVPLRTTVYKHGGLRRRLPQVEDWLQEFDTWHRRRANRWLRRR